MSPVVTQQDSYLTHWGQYINSGVLSIELDQFLSLRELREGRREGRHDCLLDCGPALLNFSSLHDQIYGVYVYGTRV